MPAAILFCAPVGAQDETKDAVRLYGAQNGTDQEKALALYSHGLRVLGQGDVFKVEEFPRLIANACYRAMGLEAKIDEK